MSHTSRREASINYVTHYGYIEDLPEDATVSQMMVRLQRIDDLWEKFFEYLIDIKTHELHDSTKNPVYKGEEGT